MQNEQRKLLDESPVATLTTGFAEERERFRREIRSTVRSLIWKMWLAVLIQGLVLFGFGHLLVANR